ncbi:hypothetical protein CCO02nite_29440 [Cellulomonas composti]|uniref:Gram-positive cocci surface proteins LPxTG domain-containing protein n=1 Tax=Cellulomonas composti TaxID=266130 RepID=A0A511JED5_9CELL|nr:hypothetical protein CCO02nite_29440 [Cellulomonas composti]
MLASAAVAGALVVLPAAGPALADDELHTHWDGRTVVLAWDGTEYTTLTTSFVGVPVTVPGDRVHRTLVARNDGPTTAVLTGWVVDVDLEQPAGSSTTFFDDVHVTWDTASGEADASLRTLSGVDRTRIAQVELDPGESTALVVGYAFDIEATSGNRSQDGELQASFDVQLRLSEGELTPPTPTPTPTDPTPTPTDPTPTPSPTDPGPPVPSPTDGGTDGDDGDGGDLAHTGAEVLQAGGLAAGTLAGGILLLLAARRRRRAHR